MASVSEFVLNYVINATWQIAAIALVAAAGSYLLKNAPASYRHLLWVAALASCVVVPLLTTTHALPADQSAFIAAATTTEPQIVSASLSREPDLSLASLTKRRTRVVNSEFLPALWLTLAYALAKTGSIDAAKQTLNLCLHSPDGPVRAEAQRLLSGMR